MPAVRIPIGRNPIGVTPEPQPRVRARAVLRLAQGIKFFGERTKFAVPLTLAPVEVNYQRLALVYGEIERPGTKPLLLLRGDQLKQVSFEAIIVANANPGIDSCEDKLETLELLAKTNSDCVFVYGGSTTARHWRITELSFTSLKRDRQSDRITQAKVQITLTEASPKRQIVPGMITIRIPDEARGNTSSSSSQRNANSNGSGDGGSGDPDNPPGGPDCDQADYIGSECTPEP